MRLTDIMVSFLLMAAAVFLLLRRSYETDRYYGQFPLDGSGGFSAAEALTTLRGDSRRGAENCSKGFSLRLCASAPLREN